VKKADFISFGPRSKLKVVFKSVLPYRKKSFFIHYLLFFYFSSLYVYFEKVEF